MTQEGFENYLYSVYDSKNGTAKSYITAIRIIDEMFRYDDVFDLNGTSVTCIEDEDLLINISEFVYTQQSLYRKGEKSIFSNVNDSQSSYPGKGFCSAAVRQLLKYREYDIKEKEAGQIVSSLKKGVKDI